MADLVTTITDWTTSDGTTSNTPKDGEDINSATATQYSSLPNAIRDIKGVIRSESLNLAWDPASSIVKGTSLTWPTVTAMPKITVPSGPESVSSVLVGPFIAKWKRCVEGQMFQLKVRTNVGTTPEAYAYYTGFISAILNSYSDADTDNPSGCQIFFSGMYRWTTTDSTRVAVVMFEDAVVNAINDVAGDIPDVYLDFSSYPPTQNPAYVIPNTAVQRTTGVQESCLQTFEQSTLPRRRQGGRLRLGDPSTVRAGVAGVDAGKLLTAVFPYPEPDTDYSVSIIPIDTDMTISTEDNVSSRYFSPVYIAKSLSFFVVQFWYNTGSDYIEFDWEISRSY